jgi:hypothetical protein
MKATLPFLLTSLLALPGPVHAGPAPAGKVLVLENENTMEGDVTRVGDQYRVRRSVGETWVPAAQVACVCGSIEEAYQFVRGRANLHDADERLRLAQWCRTHGLHAQAVVEVRAAVGLRPGHAETRRILAVLEQSAPARPARAPSRPGVPEGPAPEADVTGECLGVFATRVQPVLMNACAHCHTPAYAGPFKLVRCYETGVGNRRSVQQNLAAVLAQVNFAQPQSSPLLTRALSDHGKVGQAPLRGRQATAYRTLEDWVRRTVEDNPQLRQAPATAAAAPPGALRQAAAFGEDAARPATPPAATVPAPAVSPGTPPRAAPSTPAPAAAPDPFDPEEFNRLAHPERTRPPPPPPAGRPGGPG